MFRSIVFLFLFTAPAVVCAQFTYVIDQGIPVSDLQGSIALPWAGGLNATQYNTIDLNQDQKDDLVVFDRMANKIFTFLSENAQYNYHPEYEAFFPSEVSNFLMLRDYNCDGKKDIFTGDPLGIKVYKNETASGSNLSWAQYFFYTGSSTKSAVLQTKGFTTKINLQIQFDDLPAIVDADGDGDLDIFNMQFVGNGTVEYHQNFSKERYGSCDSLDFERITQAWGNFKECECAEFAFGGSDCPPAGGRVKHAGGKSLLALDLNGDQQQDLLFSEAECTQLYQLINEGTTSSAAINSFSTFPSSSPINFFIFPAAFYEDVDFDGKKDLLSSPNIYSKATLAIDLQQSNWFYKNTGTNATPQFTFVQKNFLQDQMIDVGDNSKPAFADYDKDGDADMFISRNSSDHFAASIFLYENTGSASNPAFTLVTEDYLNFLFGSFYNLKIQFIDINGDNASDLIFTATSFDTGLTGLYNIINKSTGPFDFGGQSVKKLDFPMTFNDNIYLTKIDADGLPDILAGRGNGNVELWRNTGTADNPAFVREATDYLGLSSLEVQNISCASGDLDADGKADLVVGDETGRIKIIRDYKADGIDSVLTDITFNPLNTSYVSHNFGGRLWPVVENLFNSTRPAIVTGNILGGISILKNDEGKSLSPNPVISVFPNPVKNNDIIKIQSDRPVQMQVLTVLGQQASSPLMITNNEAGEYRIPFLSPGLYLLKFTSGKNSTVKRLVVY